MPRSYLLSAGLILLVSILPATAQIRADNPDRLAPLPGRLTSPVLERFASEAEFRRYLRDIHREQRKRSFWASRAQPVQVAALQDQDVPCAKPEDCPKDADEQDVVVTGTRAAPPSITNNQEAGVDEGDIVKQIGRYLLVLQDGRIFSVDTAAAGGLAMIDRVNVYRDAAADTWYDEMLVQDDHVLVTGYSYEEEATEVSVFRLSKQGKLSAEGVFLISSNDYYDIDNYATRLVGDQLILYSPLDLSDIDVDEPIKWPVVRRWLPEAERDEARQRGTPLFDARAIYKPVQQTLAPIVHTISFCPIGPVRKGRDMRCRSVGMIGPGDRQFYVTPDDVFLWVTPNWSEYAARSWRKGCDSWERRAPSDSAPATAYRISIADPDDVGAMRARGVPIDQFSFDASNGRLRALLAWMPIRCDQDQDKDIAGLRFLDVPLADFGTAPAKAPPRAYTELPGVGTNTIENRFTDAYLVYGGRNQWGHRPPDEDDAQPAEASAVAVPISAPGRAASFKVPHSVIRLERLGNDAVLTGYRDRKGLNISVLDLSAAPRLGPPLFLPDRFESEGRSHAFNSAIEADGHGLFGIPTVRGGDDDSWWWRSEPSDVSFFSLDRARRPSPLGELVADKSETAVDRSYTCEVSCIDWYGNSRPIFTGGRVFALSATELIEGRVEGGRIVEVRRLNLSRPFAPAKSGQ